MRLQKWSAFGGGNATVRRIDLSEWKKQKARVLQARLRTDNAFIGGAPGNRPRDPESERILGELDKARWERYLQSGKIEKLAPRRYRLRIDLP